METLAISTEPTILGAEKFFIRRIDSEDNDGRFYQGVLLKWQVNGEGVLIPGSEVETNLWTRPSVTYKLDVAYPKDPYLIKWIRENGKEGQKMFEDAADDGTEVHIIIDRLLGGEKIPTEGLNKRVKKCVQAFIDWYLEFNPKIIKREHIVTNEKYNYAGTLDLVCELNYIKGKTRYKGIYVVDYKTSKSTHEIHKVQISAYQKAEFPKAKTAILHLGNQTKAGYSFLPFVPGPYWAQFKNVSKMFDMMKPDAQPIVENYPVVFSL